MNKSNKNQPDLERNKNVKDASNAQKSNKHRMIFTNILEHGARGTSKLSSSEKALCLKLSRQIRRKCFTGKKKSRKNKLKSTLTRKKSMKRKRITAFNLCGSSESDIDLYGGKYRNHISRYNSIKKRLRHKRYHKNQLSTSVSHGDNFQKIANRENINPTILNK